MKELLDIIQIPFVNAEESAEHFQRLDAELARVQAGADPAPSWLTGVVTLRPCHQLEMEHSVRQRQGKLYCETRVSSDPSRRATPPAVRPLPEEGPPTTERATPDSKGRR